MLTLPRRSTRADKPDTSDQTVVAHRRAAAGSTSTRSRCPQADVVDAAPERPRDDQPSKTVYLKGDQDAPYGAIMKMMDALRKAGIETVGLITDPPARGSKREGGQ